MCHSAYLHFLNYGLCTSFTLATACDVYHLHKQDLDFLQAVLFL